MNARPLRLSIPLVLGLALAAPSLAAGGSALRDQIKTILSDYRTQARTYQDQARTCTQTYLTGIQTVLMLDEAMLEALEEQLDAGFELAEERFEALDAGDQTLANYKTILLEELKKVTDGATADAGQRAQLDTLSATYADCILPIKMMLSTLRADTRAKIMALIQAAR